MFADFSVYSPKWKENMENFKIDVRKLVNTTRRAVFDIKKPLRSLKRIQILFSLFNEFAKYNEIKPLNDKFAELIKYNEITSILETNLFNIYRV